MQHRNMQNVVAGVIVIVLGLMIYWIANSLGSGGLKPDPMGPAIYPKVLGAVLTALGLLLVWIPGEKSRQREPKEERTFLQSGGIRVLLVIAASLFYIFIMERLGYILSTIILIVLIMVFTGERKIMKIGLFSVLLSVGLYFLFRELLNVLLPSGFGL